MKEPAIIVDLDGTLADSEHRKIMLPSGKIDWEYFLDPDHIKDDKINKWCVEMIRRFRFRQDTIGFKNYHLLIVTGRNEKQIPETMNWLKKHNILTLGIFCRKDNDFRPDTEIKKEIYEEHIKDGYDVLFVIDDRKKVVDMWRSIGLTCLQCAEGDY